MVVEQGSDGLGEEVGAVQSGTTGVDADEGASPVEERLQRSFARLGQHCVKSRRRSSSVCGLAADSRGCTGPAFS